MRIDDGGNSLQLFSPDTYMAMPPHVSFRRLYAGVLDGWHRYACETVMACLEGMVKLVMYDGRGGSSTEGLFQEVHFGLFAPLAVSIPPGVDHALKSDGGMPAALLIARGADCPDEGERASGSSPAYDWSIEFK